MTPVSNRGISQREHVSSQDIPMDIDDGWGRHQSPPPALTPDVDDLMDFGDSERPTTPPISERTSPIRQDSPLSSAPPSPHAPTNNVDLAAPFPDIPPESRYSLRTRKPQQKNPYLYDQVHYKLLMKNNPDAIVKMREVEKELRHRNDDQYEQGTQDPEPDEYEHRHRISHSRSKSRHQSEALPDGLEALPDFDAEDRAINKGMRDAKKELAKIKRRREQAKEEEEEKRRRKEEEEAEELRHRAATPPSINVRESIRLLLHNVKNVFDFRTLSASCQYLLKKERLVYLGQVPGQSCRQLHRQFGIHVHPPVPLLQGNPWILMGSILTLLSDRVLPRR